MLKRNFLRMLLVGSMIHPAIAQEPVMQCNEQFNFCIDRCSDDDECFKQCEIALENCYGPERENTEPEDDNESIPNGNTDNEAQEDAPNNE